MEEASVMHLTVQHHNTTAKYELCFQSKHEHPLPITPTQTSIEKRWQRCIINYIALCVQTDLSREQYKVHEIIWQAKNGSCFL